MTTEPPFDQRQTFCRKCAMWLFKVEFCSDVKKCKGWLRMKKKADRIVNKTLKKHNKRK